MLKRENSSLLSTVKSIGKAKEKRKGGGGDMKRNLFDLLSDDVLLHVYSYLDMFSVLVSSLVCKRFFKVCDSDEIWRLYNKKLIIYRYQMTFQN